MPDALKSSRRQADQRVMSVEWCEENGLRFLFVDYRNQTVEENFATFAEQVRIVETSPPGQRVLIHVDPNHRPDSRFLADVKHGMREVMAPRGTKVAFAGISGLGLTIVRGLNLVGGGMGAAVFPTREKALAYLARG